MKNNKHIIIKNQPLSDTLRNSLPVNYFLFVNLGSIKLEKNKMPQSKFHNTEEYLTIKFYKAISNIL
jgi:hypothetical protein